MPGQRSTNQKRPRTGAFGVCERNSAYESLGPVHMDKSSRSVSCSTTPWLGALFSEGAQTPELPQQAAPAAATTMRQASAIYCAGGGTLARPGCPDATTCGNRLSVDNTPCTYSNEPIAILELVNRSRQLLLLAAASELWPKAEIQTAHTQCLQLSCLSGVGVTVELFPGDS